MKLDEAIAYALENNRQGRTCPATAISFSHLFANRHIRIEDHLS